jgi:RNA polymerase sigma-70 factor, ECF subfamily
VVPQLPDSPSAQLPSLLPALLPKLWRFALRLTRNRGDAQDLVQCTCVRALERQHQWCAEGTPLPWLYAIVHSIWMNEERSRRLHPVQSFCDSADEDGEERQFKDGGTTNPQDLAYFHQVVAAIDALPDAHRTVMLLVAIEGLSYREAADVLEMPIGTVMSRLYRARLIIGERFADSHPLGRRHGTR